MIRHTLVIASLLACLLATGASAEDTAATSPEPAAVTEEAPAPSQEASVFEPGQDALPSPCAKPMLTSTASSNGCETISDPCERYCCNEWKACYQTCGFDIPCYLACDQQNVACNSAC